MIYISPNKKFESKDFNNEISILPKIQIDNSLRLGMNNIMLVTNFNYEYKGVKAIVVPDDCYCEFRATASKLKTIIYLINNKMINELCWYHDLDAFQLGKITNEEILEELNNRFIGMTDYGKSSINSQRDLRWSTGSIFFNNRCINLLDIWWKLTNDYKVNEEISLLELLKKYRYRYFVDSIKKINITYNLATRKRDVLTCYNMARKPLKVIHFHLHDDRKLDYEKGNNIDVCIKGKSRIGKPLVTPELINIFNQYEN